MSKHLKERNMVKPINDKSANKEPDKFILTTKTIIVFLLCAAVCFSFVGIMPSVYGDTDISSDDGNHSAQSGSEHELSETSAEPASLAQPKRNTLKYAVDDIKYGYISGKTVQELTEDEVSEQVCAYANLNYKFVGWSDGVEAPARNGDTVNADTVLTAIFEYAGLPCINISVKNRQSVYTAGTCSVSGCCTQFETETLPMQIKRRGNASAWFKKPSYKIKFDEKINLLGIGNAARKDWCLISNHCDQSLIRNYYAFSLARKFNGLPTTLGATLVNVYLNGKYDGVYMLTEEIEVNDSRVNIDTTGENSDIGFLIEWDKLFEGTANVDYVIAGGIRFSISSDYQNSDQIQYLKNYLTKCDSAIRSGNREDVERYIDIDSMVDMYILQEYVKNIDVGWGSLYMYIEENGGKLTYGPVWDFDLAMGNDERLDNGSYEKIYVGSNYKIRQTNIWFVYAFKTEWFKALVANRWQELKPVIDTVTAQVCEYVELNREQLEANFTRWKIFGSQINQEPAAIRALRSYDEHYCYLINWLSGRKSWLDSYYTDVMFKQ